jgi:branched-chain amino acid aminotransferase
MQRDAALMRVPFEISPKELSALLHRLIDANGAQEATLRVVSVRNKGGMFEAPGLNRDADLIALSADLAQWNAGVKLGIVPNARHAASPFAGAKVTSWSQNLSWYEKAHEQGLDEVILLNEHGQVSECTSANVFAIRGKEILTPPLLTSGCLPGVTRALLLEEIAVPGLHICERDLTTADLLRSDGLFITSSTRDVLSVAEIDGQQVPQSPEIIARLQNAFVQYRNAYIAAHLLASEAVTS